MVTIIGKFYDTKDEALKNEHKNESIVAIEPNLFQKEGYLVVKNSILAKCGWDINLSTGYAP